MKILLGSERYPPAHGGQERHVRTLAHALAARGHDVTVATSSRVDPVDGPVRVVRLRGWSHRLPGHADNDHPLLPPMPDPGIVQQWRALVHDVQPDVVHVRGGLAPSALVLRDDERPPTVVTLHDHVLACPKRTLLRNDLTPCVSSDVRTCFSCARPSLGAIKALGSTIGLRRRGGPLHRQADALIAISSSVADAARAAVDGLPPIEVIPSFVADQVLVDAAVAPRPDFVPDGPYLAFAGTVAAHKGIDVLLAARARMTHPLPLVLVGPRSVELDLPADVVAVGPRVHADVLGTFRHATAVVVPSAWAEPFGQVAVEAMATATAVIASDTGGLRDTVVDDATGLLVPPGDIAALAVALERIAVDPALTARLAAAGPARAARFTISTVVEEIESVYVRARNRRSWWVEGIAAP